MNFFIVTIIVVIFTGCSSKERFFNGTSSNQYYSSFSKGPVPINNIANDYDGSISEHATDFDRLAYDLIRNRLCNVFENDEQIYVADFVDQKNYNNKSELGFVLADAVKVNLQKRFCNKTLQIKSLDMSKFLIVNKNGFSMLTRKLSDLKENYIEENRKILLGTYTITANQLIVYVRLVNLKDETTLLSSSISVPITYEILQLNGHEFLKDNVANVKKPFHL